jgi:branched-chain amino acid transport system permease protein
MIRFEGYFLLGFLLVALTFVLCIRSEYLLHIVVMVLFYTVLATSLNLIVGYTGEFPLGHAAYFGIGAYFTALCSTKLGLPLWLLLPASGIVSMIFGLMIGSITLRLTGPFFAIVTLAFAEVLRLLANNWIGLTNGPMGISAIPAPGFIGETGWLGGKRGFALLGLLIAGAMLFLAYRLVNSNAGRAAVTLRENRYVAMSIGIDPLRCALFIFAVAAFMAGVGGAYYATYISFVGPEVFGFPFMVSMIIIVLLGGKGTLAGPVIGALVVTLMEEYLREAREFRLSIFGLIVMGVVLFSPNGIMGYLRGYLARRPLAEAGRA